MGKAQHIGIEHIWLVGLNLTFNLCKGKQADVARREDQITRLLATLDRHKSKEQVLLEELKQMTEKKDAYKRELKDMRALVKHATEAGRAAKAAADKGTMFTIIS